MKGTGLANTCPVVETGESGSKIPAKDYNLEKFCNAPWFETFFIASLLFKLATSLY